MTEPEYGRQQFGNRRSVFSPGSVGHPREDLLPPKRENLLPSKMKNVWPPKMKNVWPPKKENMIRVLPATCFLPAADRARNLPVYRFLRRAEEEAEAQDEKKGKTSPVFREGFVQSKKNVLEKRLSSIPKQYTHEEAITPAISHPFNREAFPQFKSVNDRILEGKRSSSHIESPAAIIQPNEPFFPAAKRRRAGISISKQPLAPAPQISCQEFPLPARKNTDVRKTVRFASPIITNAMTPDLTVKKSFDNTIAGTPVPISHSSPRSKQNMSYEMEALDLSAIHDPPCEPADETMYEIPWGSRKVAGLQSMFTVRCPAKDQFINSPNVYSLSGCNFKAFLDMKDAAMVMFYKPSDSQSCWSKLQFSRAARETVRSNHAYAAVNCSDEPELCVNENVTTIPMFKVYSRGYTVGTVREPYSFDSTAMRNFVERCPVLQESRATSGACMLDSFTSKK